MPLRKCLTVAAASTISSAEDFGVCNKMRWWLRAFRRRVAAAVVLWRVLSWTAPLRSKYKLEAQASESLTAQHTRLRVVLVLIAHLTKMALST